jgi:hypothetical protein
LASVPIPGIITATSIASPATSTGIRRRSHQPVGIQETVIIQMTETAIQRN